VRTDSTRGIVDADPVTERISQLHGRIRGWKQSSRASLRAPARVLNFGERAVSQRALLRSREQPAAGWRCRNRERDRRGGCRGWHCSSLPPSVWSAASTGCWCAASLYCFGCGRDGSIYDFAALLTGRGTRGVNFAKLRREFEELMR
jgi:hypothetical protein